MQTEDIILWVDKAIDVREDSYVPVSNIGRYTISDVQALTQTRPEEAKEYDFSIACLLIVYGNDITDWKKEISLDLANRKLKKSDFLP